jgi:hypothetical protein
MAGRKRATAPAFPDRVPPALQARLRVIAEGFAATAGLASPKASDRWTDAKAIQKKAADLTKLVRAWHKEFSGLAIDAGAREGAERDLADLGLDAGEVTLARAGFDPHALRFVLLGLQVHLRAVQLRHPKGPDELWRARLLVKIAAEEFRKAKLPVTRVERKSPKPNLFAKTCTTMFAISGVAGRKGQTTDPVDLIRELKEGRRKRPPRPKKPEPD